MLNEEIFKSVLDSKIVAILRGLEYEDNFKVIDTLIDSGIKNIEVTLNTCDAFEIIYKARERYGKSAYIGAGTVKNKADAENAIKAGAQFMLSPNLSCEAVKFAVKHDILFIPGVLTPTEIVQAQELGCNMVKLFPASGVAKSYIKDIKGPLNDIKIMAVGGIDLDNIPEYIENKADAFGIGGKLIRSDLIKQGDFKKLKAHFELFVESAKVKRG